MYQRNYAWDEGEITQLIQDIIDYIPEKHNYYIGTLVVFERTGGKRSIYETIDGQQRLTTLCLLTSYLKKEKIGDFSRYEKLAIDFESRKHSRRTFDVIFKGGFENDPSEHLSREETNTAIINGYKLIKRILPQKIKENKITLEDFAGFLSDKVQIMRVKVPKDTNLNHYFEIMNSRGEQLEKHEVLKSRMMEELKNDQKCQNCIHVVWEACANMEKYAQMGFLPAQRDAIFGAKNWGCFNAKNFEELREIINQSVDQSPDKDAEQTLDEILDNIINTDRNYNKQSKEDETPERFNTVINFQNFLLHVLRIQTGEDIPLDDKRLIPTFEKHVLKNNAAEEVRKFIFNLLRCKFLYDQYVIKREFIKGSDGWSLKRFKWNDSGATNGTGRGYYVNSFGDEDTTGAEDGTENHRRILMLLSAFHVSTPTLVYKHWLNAVLHYLYTNETIESNAYLNHLESVAKAFVFDRFLAPNDGLDYYEMIYTNKGRCQAEHISEECMAKNLSFGNIKNNLIFNYLDYLLWLEHRNHQDHGSKIKDFEFTFRSSVEHFYAQNPRLGEPLLPDALNSFGNLCLISHSKNSQLSNHTPGHKKGKYGKNTIDSIKQYLMMDDKRWPRWDESSIKTHGEEMIRVFSNALKEKTETRGC